MRATAQTLMQREQRPPTSLGSVAGRLRDAVLTSPDEAGERRRQRSPAANDSHLSGHVDLPDPAAACPGALLHGWQKLAAILTQASEGGVLHLHLAHAKNDQATPWLLRQRKTTGLEQFRYPAETAWDTLASTLDWLISLNRDEPNPSVVRLNIGLGEGRRRTRLNIERWRSGDNCTWSIVLCGNDDLTLDQRCLPGEGLSRFKEALTQDRGLILVACRDDWHREQLVNTLARDLVAPDRRLLVGSRNTILSSPATLAVNVAATDTQDNPYLRACMSDVDIVLNAMPQSREAERAQLAQGATTRLTLQMVCASSPEEAIRAASVCGWPSEVLDSLVHTVIVEHRVTALCRECCHSATPTSEEENWLAKHHVPNDAAQLRQWFEQQQSVVWHQAHGCHFCNGSGVARIASFPEVFTLENADQTLLQQSRSRKRFAAELIRGCQNGQFALTDAMQLL